MTGTELATTIIQRRGSAKFGVTGNAPGVNDFGQCTAVQHDMEVVLFGGPKTFGNAVDMFANGSSGLYYKLAGNVQIEPGDAVFQGGDKVLGTDPRYGHTFMSTQRSAPGQPIWGYSQNYPTNYPPYLRQFPRNGLIGVLRAKVLQSGQGGSVPSDTDLVYREMFAEACYLYGPGRVPDRGERRMRMDATAPSVWNDVVMGPESRGKIGQMLVADYNYILGRAFKPNIGINFAVEIAPRVESIVNRQTAYADHKKQIWDSQECIDWQAQVKAALSGQPVSDPAIAAKLAEAIRLAEEGKLTLDKITKLKS